MSDKIQRVTRTELEKRLAELQGEDRFMSANDQLVHLEVQGVMAEQHQQGLSIAKLQVTVDGLMKLVDSMVLDRADLKTHVTRLQGELEQMHVRQNATEARLDTLKAIFDAGLEEIRGANEKIDQFIKNEDENSGP